MGAPLKPLRGIDGPLVQDRIMVRGGETILSWLRGFLWIGFKHVSMVKKS
jgi:hypothetical protein